jgi:putative heme-binding domain-containing protein
MLLESAAMSKVVVPTVLIVLLLITPLRAADPPADEGIALLIDVLKTNDDASFQLDILKGINAALEGRRRIQAPAAWAEVRGKLVDSKNPDVRAQARALAVVFGDDAVFVQMRQTLSDDKAPQSEREAALQSLLAAGDPTLGKTLQSLVTDPALRTRALQGLVAYDDPATPATILGAYGSFNTEAKQAALATLAGRLSYAKALIEAVEAGRVPRPDLTAATVRQLRDLGDKHIDAFVAKHWGVARATPAEKQKEIDRWKSILTDQRLHSADASRGRAVFLKTCAQCHTLYGEGGKVGPDLTGSNRANLDYALLNILDPSAVIAKEYQVTLIRTKDGRVINGIATPGENSVKLLTETGPVVIPKNEIDRMKQSDLSMMPEGLISGMTEEQVADLIAYLRTTTPVEK